MGHLFSRALKRFTQCSNSGRNQLPAGSGSEQRGAQDATQRDQRSDIPIIQSIPVGQSIDSAEYAAFKTSSNSFEEAEDKISGQDHSTESKLNDDKENEGEQATSNDQSKPEVEEAVIKIQALVRGHLTRKALKDAQQQAATVPPNALGQSQFDEESLRNPPNAVFSNASPANTSANLSSLNNNQHQSSKVSNNRVPPLESIAEDVEAANHLATSSRRENIQPLSLPDQPSINADVNIGELAEPPSPSLPRLEANASIDINCETPASASIDIKDHTSKSMPVIAAVLHHNGPKASENSTGEQEGEQQQQQQQRQATTGIFDSPNLANFESSLDDAMNTSSLPSSPPHINLAAATNSHSIDSAEAAAIRIQSAFRGYHTRKHSPYRRRSPANVSSSTTASRHANHINGTETNGQSKRSTLHQQDAEVFDEDDDDEGCEGCERLAGAVDGKNEEDTQNSAAVLADRLTNISQESEDTRRSRQRHRSDEAPTLDGASNGQTSVKGRATNDDADDQSTVTGRADSDQDGPTVLSDTTHKIAALTSNDDEEHSAEQPDRPDSNLFKDRLSIGDAGVDAVRSTSLDTDSSNLGAALSLNEDLSEAASQVSQGRSTHQHRLSQQQDSISALIETVEESVGGALQTDGLQTSIAEDLDSQQLDDELNLATSQLEAALDEATEDSRLEGNVVQDEILDEHSQHNLNELESDDIERRHPSGLVSEETRSKSPQASELEQRQPALVASDSLEERDQDRSNGDAFGQPRLDVISPDEAIGSGGSSPALARDGNSSDDGAESDQDQEALPQQEGGPSGQGAAKSDNNGQGGSGGKNRKKNRNKRKGKK